MGEHESFQLINELPIAGDVLNHFSRKVGIRIASCPIQHKMESHG